MSQEIEDTIKRIQNHKGVIGVIIVNNDGIPLKSTLDNTTSVHYATQIHSLASKAQAVIREIDSSNDLRFLRVRSKKHEILVAPGHVKKLIEIVEDLKVKRAPSALIYDSGSLSTTKKMDSSTSITVLPLD